METQQLDSSNIVFSENGFKYHKDIDDTEDDGQNLKEKSEIELPKIENEQDRIDLIDDNIEGLVDFQDYISNPRLLNDITCGLEQLEFEGGLLENEVKIYKTVRLRTHASYIYASAHAAYFTGLANKIKLVFSRIRFK